MQARYLLIYQSFKFKLYIQKDRCGLFEILKFNEIQTAVGFTPDDQI
jgi:hypothetical protein